MEAGRKAAARKGKGIFEGSGRCCGRWSAGRPQPEKGNVYSKDPADVVAGGR